MFYKAVVVDKMFYNQCVANGCIDEDTGKLSVPCSDTDLYCKYAQLVATTVTELYTKLNSYLIDIGKSENNVKIFLKTIRE